MTQTRWLSDQEQQAWRSRGLVTRGKCETDQRDAIIAITPVGTDLTVATAPAHVADVRTALIDHLTEPELHALPRSPAR
jgi:hypothetical protein